ncbi:hypothetical protein GQ44DRAFT_443235 [Phaeosphaeriaceae sp. PMI808]|nr:hypothetical protein GQ44DRAFT_443235 [Phaeosphaeriaceae sp. PMI808]
MQICKETPPHSHCHFHRSRPWCEGALALLVSRGLKCRRNRVAPLIYIDGKYRCGSCITSQLNAPYRNLSEHKRTIISRVGRLPSYRLNAAEYIGDIPFLFLRVGTNYKCGSRACKECAQIYVTRGSNVKAVWFKKKSHGPVSTYYPICMVHRTYCYQISRKIG